MAIDFLRMPAYRRASIGPWGLWRRSAGRCWRRRPGWPRSAAVAMLLATSDPRFSDYEFLFRNGDPAGLSLLILSYVVLVATLPLRSGARVGTSRCSALVRPRGPYVVYAIVWTVLSLLLTFAHSTQFDVTGFLNPHGFDRARLMNGLLIHFAAV